jgi:DHA2 family multidrug resistance protein
MLQRVLGYTAYETGITLLPASLLSLVLMPFIGRMLQNGVRPQLFVTLGFLTLMGFGILMSQADQNVTKSFFTLPLIIRGAGLALLFVPLNAMAVAGLQPKDIPQGVALNNMMRQLGGSFGIAIINNYLAHRVAVHRTDLISHIYSGSAQFTERYNQIYQGLQSKLPVTANLQQQTYQIIELTVMKQTYLLSYLDAFLYATLFILFAFPLLLFTRRSRLKSKEVLMAAEEV